MRKKDAAKLNGTREKALRDLRVLVDMALDGWVRLAVDDGLRIVAASEGFYRSTGYSREELMAPPIEGRAALLLVPEDWPVVQERLTHLQETGEAVRVRYRLRRRDGAVAWKEAFCAGVDEQDGERVVDVYSRDTTSRLQTERELAILVDHIPAGIVRTRINQEYEVLFANQTFYQQIGYTPEAFASGSIQGCFQRIVHPEDQPHLLASALDQAAQQEEIVLDFRILTNDGEIRWLNTRALRVDDPLESRQTLLCIITDITKERQQQLEYALNEERYRIISDQTKDTVFDWDLETDLIQFSPMYEKMFGFPPPPDLPISFLTQSDIIYEEDKALVDAMIAQVREGQPYAECTYRAKCADGSFLWCRNRITTIFNDKQQPVHAIGILTDINDLKQESAALRQQAMRDSMTGLLNRGAMRQAIEDTLQAQPEGRHAFLQFDVDHFKQINDFMGHGAGDTALQQIADLLMEQFGHTALIGRMGGDEFAVFLPQVAQAAQALNWAESLCRAIHGELRSGGKIYPLSVSLGVALYPEHGTTYQALYEHADQALYRAKANGGDGYMLYSPMD